jgi:predicted ribosomally synthesized peptide with nif11-like leader|tara:strand:+ start:68 stop:448 length:381 start_codon:yes stop_codon:yes gene_type:complete
MSQESLEQFMEKVGSDDELRASIESQLDSDGNVSMDVLIALGAENGCEFTTEDLTQNVELSDEELDGVAGGTNSDANTQSSSNYDAVSFLPEMGIVKGYEDGTFQPESYTNRVKWLMARIQPSRIG